MKKTIINTKFLLTILIFIAAFIPASVASGLYYYAQHNSLTKQAKNYEYQFLNDIQRNYLDLEERFSRIQYEVTSQFVTTSMYKINMTNLKEGQIQNIRAIENLLQSIHRTTPGINNIYIINTENQRITYGSTNSYNQDLLLSMPWVTDTYTNSREWVLSAPHLPTYVFNSIQRSVNCISFTTGLVNINRDASFEYILQIDLSMDYLFSLVQGNSTTDQSLTAIRAGDTILHADKYTDQELQLFTRTFENFTSEPSFVKETSHELLCGIKIPSLDISVCKISTPWSSSGFRDLIIQFILLLLLSLILSAISAIKIAQIFVTPFERLIQETMIGIESTDNLKKVSVECNNSDVFLISQHFNILIEKINELMKRSVDHEKEKRKLQMRMLQSQISPHFLYNTLNSIKWLALIKQQNDIAEMVTSLVDLLEYCCKDTKSLTSIQDELNFLKNYVYIQQIRNPDANIRITYQLDSVLSYKIVKLTLQPAVENAFLHAFNSQSVDPHIIIRGTVKQDKLVIQIIDNGIGFNTDIVKNNMTGIGLCNVDERIKLTFGEEYGQTITSIIGTGTTVTLTFPLTD